MCPEFASDRMDRDWHTRDRRQHRNRTSSARNDSRFSSDRDRNVVRRDSHRTERLEVCEPRRSPHDRDRYNSDDRNETTERSRLTSSNFSSRYRHNEHFSTSQRSRSRSPGRQKVVSGSDSYTHQQTRNDSHMRRHTDDSSSRRNMSQERSPYGDEYSHSRLLPAHARDARPSERDRYVDDSRRHSANELESLNHKEMLHLNEDKARRLKYSYADVLNSDNSKVSSRHCDQPDDYSSSRHSKESLKRQEMSRLNKAEIAKMHQSKYSYTDRDSNSGDRLADRQCSDQPITDDCSSSRRSKDSLRHQEMSRLNKAEMHLPKYSYDDRDSNSGDRLADRHSSWPVTDDCSSRRSYSSRHSRELYENTPLSRHDHVSSSYDDSAFSDYRPRDSNGRGRSRTTDVSDQRSGCRDVASPMLSRNDTNSKSRRDRRNKRRRSPQSDKYLPKEDETVSVRGHRKYTDDQCSTSRDKHGRDGSAHRNTDRTNNTASFEESTLKEQILSEKHHEMSQSVANNKKPVGYAEHISESCVSCRSGNNEETNTCPSHSPYFAQKPQTDSSVAIPAVDAEQKQCFAVTVQDNSSSLPIDGNITTASSSYRITTSSSAAGESIYLGSLPQPIIHSHLQWVGSDDTVTGVNFLTPQWPTSTMIPQHTSLSRLPDFVPTAAVTQLPLLSTRISALPVNAQSSGMLLPSNVSYAGVASSTSFNLAGVGGQYVTGDVYGDSPLLDEPNYYSPAPIHDSSLQLVGSSISSSDYTRPELVPSMDDAQLRKMLDVINVAKTSLEHTLPNCCLHGHDSWKQQKAGNAVERVAEEVKSALKPFFVRSEIDKEEYKDIMRRAVPKIASSKAGIDTKRVRDFVASYVAKVKAAQKRAVAAKQHVVQQQVSTNLTPTVDDVIANT